MNKPNFFIVFFLTLGAKLVISLLAKHYFRALVKKSKTSNFTIVEALTIKLDIYLHQ